MGFILEGYESDVNPLGLPPLITQCYQCQGFNHVAKDCKCQVKCMRCAKPHKSSECPGKGKDSFRPKCTNYNGEHMRHLGSALNLKNSSKKQTEKAKARQENIQNSLVVRGVSFSNIVKTNTDKVQTHYQRKSS